MAVVVINNPSSLKIKLSLGVDRDGKALTRSKTFSNVKYDASNEDVYAVANEFVMLQQHELMDVLKQDNTLLA